ncbi:magnetome protein Mad18 [Candidatus Magnetomoraceae bacterium gMMP-1]
MHKKKNISTKTNNMEDIFKYAQSTVDYTGMVTWSLATRSVNAVSKVINFSKFKKKKKKIKKSIKKRFILERQYDDKQVKELEEKLSIMEKRLAQLEKRGIRSSGKGLKTEKKKQLNNEQKGLLHQIMQDNKRLKDLKE